MKKTKKTTKKIAHKVKRSPGQGRYKTHLYGIEHEFYIIVGGSFLVIVLAILLFFQ